MTTHVVKTEEERQGLILLVQNRQVPFTANLTKGASRTWMQNKLQRKWIGEAAEQLGHTPEELRGICKLQFGVPILRAENTAFREAYDSHVKGLPYETKVAIMTEPLDMPVTRLMTTKQKTTYLDNMSRWFTEQGVYLTYPEDMQRNF